MLANQIYSQEDLSRTQGNNELLNPIDASKSAELKKLFSSQRTDSNNNSALKYRKMSQDQRLDFNQQILQQRSLAKTPSASTFKEWSKTQTSVHDSYLKPKI